MMDKHFSQRFIILMKQITSICRIMAQDNIPVKTILFCLNACLITLSEALDMLKNEKVSWDIREMYEHQFKAQIYVIKRKEKIIVNCVEFLESLPVREKF